MKFIEQGKKDATVALGGNRHGEKGNFIQPTVFTEAPETSTIMKEEIFGPVVVINKFKTEEEVLEKANNSEFGLYATVFTKNIDRAVRFAKYLEAGTVSVNCASPAGGAGFPFGGFKSSGQGREGGVAGLKAWAEIKTVVVKIEE